MTSTLALIDSAAQVASPPYLLDQLRGFQCKWNMALEDGVI
jgi:hypothetical protein